jgi:Sulfotransferase family
MLYCPERVDFSRRIVVVLHIPKTAGSALRTMIGESLGQENCLGTGPDKIGKIHPNRMHNLFWSARERVRNSVRESVRKAAVRARDIDSPFRRHATARDLEQKCMVAGHFAVGGEPRDSRTPVYLAMVRDPVDRFLSEYYFSHDLRATWPKGMRDRHPWWTYDLDRFVDFIYSRRRWTVTNVQGRYLGGRDTFEAARRAVDQRIFLAAPSQRLDECVDLLRPVLNLKAKMAAKVNVGVARQRAAAPSAETLNKIKAMVRQDQLLFEYVSRTFDDLCAGNGFHAETAAVAVALP